MGCSASSATTIAQAKKKGDVYATIHRDSDPVGGEDEGHDSKLEFLSQVPLMARLRKGERALIAAACIVQDFSKGCQCADPLGTTASNHRRWLDK